MPTRQHFSKISQAKTKQDDFRRSHASIETGLHDRLGSEYADPSGATFCYCSIDLGNYVDGEEWGHRLKGVHAKVLLRQVVS
jgi:hypothetical protein